MIMKKLLFLFFCFFITGIQLTQAQEPVITGKTTDEISGEPVPGVLVQVKGTSFSSISQADGTYSINVPAGEGTLVFSLERYQTQEIAIAGRTVIDIGLTENLESLEEIVATGYSTERMRDIVGSVSVVNTDQSLNAPSGNIVNQMQGRVSGLTISSDGSIDGGSKMRIRGFSSFSGSDPLYIIDGVPGDIDRLNPNDIQSIQVLKDAASASVYGARAASGVVVITTRQGQRGAVRVNIDYYYGINYTSKRDFPDLLGLQELGDLHWLQMKGGGREYGDENWSHLQYGNGPEPIIPEYVMVNDRGSKISGTALEAMKIADPAQFASLVDPANYDFQTHQIVQAGNTDWFDEVYNPAPVQNLQINASTGSDRGTFVLGLNFFNRKNTADKYSYSTRYNLRANSTYNIMNFIKLGENLQVSYTQGRNVGSSRGAWTFPAFCPVWDIGGMPAGTAVPTIIASGGTNPVTTPWRNRFDRYNTYSIFGNAFVEIQIFSDLLFRSSFGIDYYSTSSKNMSQITYENTDNSTPPNSLSWSNSNRTSWTFTNTLTYSKSIGSHALKILVASEANNNYSENLQGQRDDLLIDDNDAYLVLNAGTGTQSAGGTYAHNGMFSLFSRLDYSYADKYIFNVTIRRDGSSKFGKNYRYGYFPAAAIGWRITGEEFMQDLTWLSDLKLRASYGIVGNQTGLSNENQFTTYQQTLRESYPIQGQNNMIGQSFTTSRLGNQDTRWEKSVSINAGLDASLFSDALTVAFDYFIKETRDLLVTAQPPRTAPNVTQPYINVGTIKNKGMELTLTNRGRIAGMIDYEVSGNFTAYRNEVLKVLDDPEASLTGGSTRMGAACLTKQGYPISFFYGYKILGFFNTQEEVDAYTATTYNTWLPPAVGRWKIQDVNGDNIINDLDRTYIGSPHPDFQVGLNVSLSFKNFDLDGFLFWNQGGHLFNSMRHNTDFNTFQFNRSKRMLFDSWTPENKDAMLPKLDITDTYSNKYVSDYFIEDASYLRLKQVTLGYNVPSGLISRIRLAKLRIYVQAQNLFTLTRFTGMDPGVNISGRSDLSLGIYSGGNPTPKQILFGINLGF